MKKKTEKEFEQKVAFQILDVNGYNLCHSKCNKGTFTILLYEQQFTQLCTFALFSQLKVVNSRRITSGSFKMLLIITLMILSQPKLWYCLKFIVDSTLKRWLCTRRIIHPIVRSCSTGASIFPRQHASRSTKTIQEIKTIEYSSFIIPFFLSL